MGEQGDALDDEENQLEEFFGDVPKSMYVLHQSVSEGVHWGEVAGPLAEVVSVWYKLFFVVYMSFVLFAVMNVVTATFIESSLRVTAAEHQTDSALMLVTVLKNFVEVEGA